MSNPYLAALLILVVAAIVDLRTREIPDWLSVTLVCIAVWAAVAGASGVRWWTVSVGAALGLVVGVGLFRFAEFGGGDAKLIAAMGALVGPVGLLFVLFWMALAGGLLALIAVIRGQRDYAYGPAIAAGYLGYLIWPTGFLPRLISS